MSLLIWLFLSSHHHHLHLFSNNNYIFLIQHPKGSTRSCIAILIGYLEWPLLLSLDFCLCGGPCSRRRRRLNGMWWTGTRLFVRLGPGQEPTSHRFSASFHLHWATVLQMKRVVVIYFLAQKPTENGRDGQSGNEMRKSNYTVRQRRQRRRRRKLQGTIILEWTAFYCKM